MTEAMKKVQQEQSRRHDEMLKRYRENKNKPVYLKPGIYTKTFSGLPSRVHDKINDHHIYMSRTYYDYNVIDTSTAMAPSGVFVYLTYSIGGHR